MNEEKEIAVSLEQQSRMRLTGESLDQQIAKTYAFHQAEPTNIDLARRLGALNEQKDDIKAAIGWYQYAADLTKGTDPGLIRKVSDLKRKGSSGRLQGMKNFLSLTTPGMTCM